MTKTVVLIGVIVLSFAACEPSQRISNLSRSLVLF